MAAVAAVVGLIALIVVAGIKEIAEFSKVIEQFCFCISNGADFRPIIRHGIQRGRITSNITRLCSIRFA